MQQAQELIGSGRLGRVIQIYNRFAFRFSRAGSSWFTDPDLAGGGVLIDTLVHSIDIFRALAGEVVSVDAAVSTTLPVAVEDSAIHQFWHGHLHRDPGHQWLRQRIAECFGDGSAPRSEEAAA